LRLIILYSSSACQCPNAAALERSLDAARIRITELETATSRISELEAAVERLNAFETKISLFLAASSPAKETP
jgi:hypothetical protein